MSANMVSHTHIDVILTAKAAWGWAHANVFAAEEAAELTSDGRLLLAENAKSVAYRYDEPVESVDDYVFTPVSGPSHTIDPLIVINACRGLAYQSCEHPGWATSTAKRMLEDVLEGAIAHIPGLMDMPGWSIPQGLRSWSSLARRSVAVAS